MNIVYASNDNYARHLGVSMYSLMDKNRNSEQIHVYILAVALSEKNKGYLQAIADLFHRELTFIDLENLESRFDYQIDTGGFDITTMSRLFIGDLLSDDVKRVIYIDCDTVVVRSLKKMWETDLKGKILGAVMEPTIYKNVKEKIGLTDQDPYFNAGVLLIDLETWRKDNIQKVITDFYKSKDGKLFFCDQDAINGALKGRIRPLLPAYNFFTNYRYFSYQELTALSQLYQWVPEKYFKFAKKHPAIIHYMGDERPWFAGNLNHYRRAYDYYLAKTPWRGTPKEQGRELYMLAYHLMDYLTAVCPKARRVVSKKFGMKAIEARIKDDEN